jgi:hypothetical protein
MALLLEVLVMPYRMVGVAYTTRFLQLHEIFNVFS